MAGVSGARAVHRRLRRGVGGQELRPDAKAQPVFWGRIGAYEAVSRDGILFLLAPEPGHPARRVTAGA
jgi:hypothetical protein